MSRIGEIGSEDSESGVKMMKDLLVVELFSKSSFVDVVVAACCIDPGHKVTKSTPTLLLVRFTSVAASTTNGATKKQKRGKQACPAIVEDLTEADRDVSLLGTSTSSLFGGEEDYDIQDTPRQDTHHSDLLRRDRGGRPETSSSLTEKMTSMQKRLLVETIENLSKEI
jgi:hypothetical protein